MSRLALNRYVGGRARRPQGDGYNISQCAPGRSIGIQTDLGWPLRSLSRTDVAIHFGLRLYSCHRPAERSIHLVLPSNVVKLRIHVVPNAKQDKIAGEHAGAIKIKLRAPAVEGKANARLRGFLAERLHLAERAIVLEHGDKSREKIVRIDELSEPEVRRRLLKAPEAR